MPGIWPAVHTSLKHFAPAHDGGACGATGTPCLPSIAEWRSSGTTWSSAQQIGQHWPSRCCSVSGGMHEMSAHPIAEHAGVMSSMWSTSVLQRERRDARDVRAPDRGARRGDVVHVVNLGA